MLNGTAQFTGLRDSTSGLQAKIFFIEIDCIHILDFAPKYEGNHCILLSDEIKMSSLSNSFSFESKRLPRRQVLRSFKIEQNLCQIYKKPAKFLVSNDTASIVIEAYAKTFHKNAETGAIEGKLDLIEDLKAFLTVTVYIENV